MRATSSRRIDAHTKEIPGACRWITVAAAGLALIVAGCGGDDDKKTATGTEGPPATVRHAFIPSIPILPAVLAPEYQDRFNIKIEEVKFSASTDEVTALVRGDLDVTSTTPSGVIFARERGIPLVIIAGGGRRSTGIIAAKKLGLEHGDYAGLKAAAEKALASGKKLRLGAAANASTNYVECYFSLKTNGLDPKKYFETVNMPNFPDHPAQLARGETDLLCTAEPFATLAVDAAGGSRFSEPFDTPAGDALVVYVTTQKNLDDDAKRDALDRYVADLAYGTDKINKDENLKLKTAIKLLSTNEKTATEALKNNAFTIDVDPEQIRAIANMHFMLGETKKDLSSQVDEWVYRDFIDKHL